MVNRQITSWLVILSVIGLTSASYLMVDIYAQNWTHVQLADDPDPIHGHDGYYGWDDGSGYQHSWITGPLMNGTYHKQLLTLQMFNQNGVWPTRSDPQDPGFQGSVHALQASASNTLTVSLYQEMPLTLVLVHHRSPSTH